MNLDKNSQANGVSQMIEDLYGEIMRHRFELIDLKRQKRTDIADKEALVEALQSEFDLITKTHTAYLKYLKAAGKSGAGSGDSEELKSLLLKMINDTKANTGNIVTEIPKN